LVTAIVLRWPVAAEGKAILGRQSLKDLPEEDHGPPPSNHRNRRPPAHHPRRELRRHARHRTVLADGDLGGFLQDVTLSASADAEESIEFSARQLAPVIPNPRKVLCTGLNFREHIV